MTVSLARLKVPYKTILSAVLVLVVFGGWTMSSPAGSDPDSSFHLTSIWCAGDYEIGKCERGSEEFAQMDPPSVRVPNAIGLAGYCFAYKPTESAACEKDFVKSKDLFETRSNNESALYPNGYYRVMRAITVDSMVPSVLIIRTTNFLLFFLLGIVAFSAVPRRLFLTWITGVLVTSVPLQLFLMTSSNPSAWAITSVSFYWLFLFAALVETRIRYRFVQVLGLCLSALLALLSRADASLYIAVCSISIPLLVWLRQRKWSDRRLLALPVVIILLAIWTAVNSEQSSVATEGMFGAGTLDRDALHIAMLNFFRFPAIMVGTLGLPDAGGELGWLDTKMPEGVYIPILVVLSGLLMWSWQGKRGSSRLIEVFHCLLPLLIPFLILQLDTAYVGESLQGRYILPLIPVAVSLSILGRITHSGFDVSKGLLRLGGSLVSMAHSIALHINIRRYVTGTDINGINLSTNEEWWWSYAPSPMILWMTCSLCFGVIAIVVLPSLWKNKSELPSL